MRTRTLYPRKHKRKHVHKQGLSLIEALVCAGVLMLLAVPAVGAWRALFDRAQVSAAVSDLRTAIQLARMHAMQRAQRIDILPVAGDWAQGCTVLVDANNNQRVDSGETVLHARVRAAGALRVSAALTDDTRAYLAFGAGGRPRTASSPTQPQFGSFLFSHGGERRKLVIGFLGRLRSCDPDRDGSAC
jgi:type IV fimbrial biogenesis protein FimT